MRNLISRPPDQTVVVDDGLLSQVDACIDQALKAVSDNRFGRINQISVESCRCVTKAHWACVDIEFQSREVAQQVLQHIERKYGSVRFTVRRFRWVAVCVPYNPFRLQAAG